MNVKEAMINRLVELLRQIEYTYEHYEDAVDRNAPEWEKAQIREDRAEFRGKMGGIYDAAALLGLDVSKIATAVQLTHFPWAHNRQEERKDIKQRGLAAILD